MPGIVIVGAGQAGASLAARLRTSGYQGKVTLIGEEHAPPYQRPPLSKGYLLGEMAVERLFLRPESFYAENNITLRTDCRVDAIDAAARRIVLGTDVLEYEQLALVTGAVPRRLPPAIGGLLDGVHVVRGLHHIDRLSPEMVAGKRVLIVGGGYIGLEAAAVASKLGLEVTLVEMAERILQRVAAEETSDYFRALHQAHGVDLREGVGLERLTGNERVSGAVLTDGTELSVDLVIVGVGVTPATELAEAAGLALENGIAVDAQGRTSDPHIWSAGDCASFPRHGERIRLESVQNAIDQAELVALNMLGADVAYDPKIWFWSDQYDVKLQIAGLNTGYDRVVVRPDEKEGAVSHWYFAGERLLAVDAMNAPRAYMVGKRLIDAGKNADPVMLADPSSDLKALLRA
ncbi:FAD-dependent oxidoreductase [Tropicimonas sp. TH_r6]|uniref:NAD(P)/FAD-dependent oxidoreductase n=1 Tax=Tropicimonas sp. TH_r6 TaxID=3082085 RepID=UPI0029541C5B|nr:FAD-dependent oxidoreductase [Tropicimonas sp. TH_r6]MDV7144118.1 FAD-dependent oxidoreductase [Tropicimonas sp. TH_r6]